MPDATILAGSAGGELTPAPIRADWILDDGTASCYVWDCTAGRFNWHYDVDETIYIVEGSITLKDHRQGTTHTLNGGDTVFFPAGSSAEWTVGQYVRKVAFLRIPLTRKVLFLKKISSALKRLIGQRHDERSLELGSCSP